MAFSKDKEIIRFRICHFYIALATNIYLYSPQSRGRCLESVGVEMLARGCKKLRLESYRTFAALICACVDIFSASGSSPLSQSTS